MNELVLQALSGVLAPALVAVLVLGVLGRRTGEATGELRRRLALPLALGLGYGTGHVVSNGWPPLRFDVELKHALLWVALLGTALGVVEARTGRARWIPRLVLALVTPWFLLDFMREHHWARAEGWTWTVALGLCGLALMAGLQLLAPRRSEPGTLLLLSLVAAATGATLAVSGSATMGQLAGAGAAALGAAALLGGLRPRARSAAACCVPWFATLHAGLMLGGRYASELSVPGALLLGVAPLGAWLSELGPLRRRSPRLRFLVALGITGALGGGALLFEWWRKPEDPYAGMY